MEKWSRFSGKTGTQCRSDGRARASRFVDIRCEETTVKNLPALLSFIPQSRKLTFRFFKHIEKKIAAVVPVDSHNLYTCAVVRA